MKAPVAAEVGRSAVAADDDVSRAITLQSHSGATRQDRTSAIHSERALSKQLTSLISTYFSEESPMVLIPQRRANSKTASCYWTLMGAVQDGPYAQYLR